ncbi:hypothetical protein [Candidatus Neptunochlamydia vexilliferae]|nr:hypothetical protein [Candidatus Neptunochlamydia vexilliferae]
MESSTFISRFSRMLSEKSLTTAAPFLEEEHCHLHAILDRFIPFPFKELVVVGGGKKMYHEVASNYLVDYLNIDPETISINQPGTCCISKPIEEVDPTVASQFPRILWMPFNVVAYIDKPNSIIDRWLRPGDVCLISGWQKNQAADSLRSKYFQSVDPGEALPPFDPLPKIVQPEKARATKTVERIKGAYNQILAIYTTPKKGTL